MLYSRKVGPSIKVLMGLTIVIMITVMTFQVTTQHLAKTKLINWIKHIHQEKELAKAKGLVHVTGQLTSADVIDIPAYGYKNNTLKFYAVVSMYAWTEKVIPHRHYNDYKYYKIWSYKNIASAQFNEAKNHLNPFKKELGVHYFYPKTIKLNGTTIEKLFIRVLPKGRLLKAKDIELKPFIERYGKPYLVNQDNTTLYFGNSPKEPQIGDVRVSLYETPQPQTVSVLALKQHDILEPFPWPGRTKKALIGTGDVSSAQLLKNVNTRITSFEYSDVGILLFSLAIGFGLMFPLFPYMGHFIPLMKKVLQSDMNDQAKIMLNAILLAVYALAILGITSVLYAYTALKPQNFV